MVSLKSLCGPYGLKHVTKSNAFADDIFEDVVEPDVHHPIRVGIDHSIRVGIYLDADAGEVIYFRHDVGFQPCFGAKLKNVPADVRLVIDHFEHDANVTIE